MRNLALTSAVSFGLFLCAASLFGQVRVEVFTYEMDSSGSYQPLAGVEVRAYRTTGPLFDRPKETDDKGHSEFPIRPGNPFWIVFSQGDKMPELKMLAGKDGVKDSVHVALLTQSQAKEWRIPVKENLAMIQGMIREDNRFHKEIGTKLLDAQRRP